MPHVEEVADKVYRLQAPVSGLTTVFAANLSKEPETVLIEPGPTATAPSIREGMSLFWMNDLAYIIPTYIHVIHAGIR